MIFVDAVILLTRMLPEKSIFTGANAVLLSLSEKRKGYHHAKFENVHVFTISENVNTESFCTARNIIFPENQQNKFSLISAFCFKSKCLCHLQATDDLLG